MTAGELRVASGDPMKRSTYTRQVWLADWRRYGGSSSDEQVRWMMAGLRNTRRIFRPCVSC